MDKTYALIESALKRKGINVERADKQKVASALQSEGINPNDYNFSLGKKDIYIDAFENGNTIYMYKGYGSSKALCHEFIHKWWKKNGKSSYAPIIKAQFPNKWEEVCSSPEYSKILDNKFEICGEVLAKSLEQDLAKYIEDNKDCVSGCIGRDLGEMKDFSKEDFCCVLCDSMFNYREKFSKGMNFSFICTEKIGILMF